MISRRAFFTFLAGGAVLLAALWPWRHLAAQSTDEAGYTTPEYGLSYRRALKQCEMIERRMAQEFSGLSLKEAELIWKAMPNWIEECGWQPTASLAWKAQINGTKWGQWLLLDPEQFLGRWAPNPAGAKKLVEVLQISLDRTRREIASRLT